MQQCAILSMDSLADFEAYDHLLDKPMAALGWKTHLVSWRDDAINWNNFDAVLIRTPWDYQEDADKFLQVLQNIENSKAHLENSLNIVRWNINKNYLKELQSNGVCIVPTLWPESFSAAAVDGYFSHFNTDQIVLKPRVSANADNTFWLTKANYQQYLPDLVAAFAERQLMVQPFIQSVLSEGEFSCFYFAGQYSHSILKTPKADDFRVQEEHGGQLQKIEPEAKLRQQAEHALAQIGEMPMYARVDFVRFGEQFAMMEAELIEPSLYFNMDDQSAGRFAKAFTERMLAL